METLICFPPKDLNSSSHPFWKEEESYFLSMSRVLLFLIPNNIFGTAFSCRSVKIIQIYYLSSSKTVYSRGQNWIYILIRDYYHGKPWAEGSPLPTASVLLAFPAHNEQNSREVQHILNLNKLRFPYNFNLTVKLIVKWKSLCTVGGVSGGE